jgi:alkylhydroperoxidase/carboxymuconolactone decarboxylase family protein YurZ
MSAENETAEIRELSGGFDPAKIMRHRGLDLSRPTEITAEEIAAFKGHYSSQFGREMRGLDWWLDKSPEVLKRYRLFCGLTLRVTPSVMGNGTLAFYALNGYETGVRYVINSYRNDGLSKAQILEVIALAFVHAGPRGMETVARALEGLEFEEEPDPPAKFPDGWAPDIEAFRSGLDFSTPELLPGERDLVESWYLKTIGEVPGHVRFLAAHRPMLLKTHRARVENMLYALPKQMWPTAMLYYNVMTRTAEGIRENVLLAKAWGVTKADTLDTIANALVYGQMEAAAMVQKEAGDVLDAWAG